MSSKLIGSSDLSIYLHVPFIDLHRLNGRFDIAGAIGRVLDSGRYLHGSEVKSFEDAFARYVGVPYCIAVANGLDALRLTFLAWLSLGTLQPGDEVLVPANSFVASALAVSECGLTIRFIDIDPDTFNVNAGTIAAGISSRTRAVMAVHLYGRIADIAEVRKLCSARGLLLIEDSAQSHGASTEDGAAGQFGDAAGFSFYPTKNLGALGDAGCVTTKDGELAERIRMLANYGSSKKYQHDFRGLNSRMDELQAAVLRLKLPRLDTDNDARRDLARRYRDGIHHPDVRLPSEPSYVFSHVWHIFAVTTKRRDELGRYLESRGIQTIIHYPLAIHRQPAYAATCKSVKAPVAEQLQTEVLSLPISPVMRADEADYVIEAINQWPT